MPREFSWTVTSQMLRILRTNTQAMSVDIFYSIGYVIAGFFLSGRHGRDHYIHMTGLYVILSCVMAYFAFRLCAAEGGRGTSVFYTNLPRSRKVSYWANVGWLCLLALFLELLALAGMRLGGLQSLLGSKMYITPVFALLPFVSISIVVWISYVVRQSWVRFTAVGVYVTAAYVGFVLIGLSYHSQPLNGELTLNHYITAAGILIATLLVTVHAGYVWSKTQIGELS